MKKVFLFKENPQAVNKFASSCKTAFSEVHKLWKSNVNILILS